MLPCDTYPQPDAPDPLLEPATVLRIVRRHVPRAAAVSAVDETGGEARVYMIDDDVVLKTQRPQQLRQRTSLEKEVSFLNALAGLPAVNVPRVLGYGRDGAVEYTVMTRVPGVAARWVTIEGESRAELLRAVGRALRAIHSIPQEPFVHSALFPGVRTVPAFEERLRAGFEHAVTLLERTPDIWKLQESARALAERILATPRPTVDLVALHSNPGPEHVFIEPNSLRLTGIIDFGDAFISHPAFDVRWPQPEDREAILGGYGPRAADSLAAWTASAMLMDMTAIASRPDRREAATKTIEAIAHAS